jgi:hypothetical protein
MAAIGIVMPASVAQATAGFRVVSVTAGVVAGVAAFKAALLPPQAVNASKMAAGMMAAGMMVAVMRVADMRGAASRPIRLEVMLSPFFWF